jgi:hypothetical protein
MTDIQPLVHKTIRHLARIHPGVRFVRDERQWVVYCRDGTWQVFDRWPGFTVYVERAMRRAKVPASMPLRILWEHLRPAMQAGPPIAVATRDDLPRNPFIGLHLAKARAAAKTHGVPRDA